MAAEVPGSDSPLTHSPGAEPTLGAWPGDATPSSEAKATPADDSAGEVSTLADVQVAATGPLPLPAWFGPYELLEEVAHGGMGVVYRARDPILGRIVALKMLRSGTLAGRVEVERFYREARAAAQLSHPNIVPIHEIGQHDARHYFTMAFVAGGSLAQHRDTVRADPKRAASLMEKVARAVHYAHEHGILHRDLKPGNILLDERGEPLVSDFGLAKLTDSEVELTQPGDVVGTPLYMSPEQAAGRTDQISAVSDVWALGVLLYELLTGQRPFSAKGREEVYRLIQTAEPRRPRALRPGLDRSLETICLKCLEKDPSRRYASAEALADDLSRWLRGEPILARPAGWVLRVWRTVRRRPTVSTSAGFLLLIFASLAILISYDPDRRPLPGGPIASEPPIERLKAIQNDLAAGKKIDLLDAKGFLSWYRSRTGKEGMEMQSDDSGLLILRNLNNLCLLEVLPDPACASYCFSAEVRHEEDHDASEVGVWLLGSERATAQGLEHCFLGLSFADVGAKAHQNSEELSSQADLTLWRYSNEGSWLRSRARLTSHRFAPRRGEWRQLKAVVTPEKISAYWMGTLLHEVDRARLPEDAKARLGFHFAPEQLREVPHGEAIARANAGARPLMFREVVGFYVNKGAAAFRNVTMEPARK